MSYRVVITVSNRPPNEITLNVIREAGFEVEYAKCLTENEVITAAKDADVLLVGTVPHTTRMVLEALPNLKMVGRSGVGVDSVDLDAATEFGICVTNTPGINTSEVADHAMAMLLSITRKIPEQNAALKNGAWSDRPDEVNRLQGQLRRIAGNTVGIFGLGNIGTAFATRVRGFGPEKIVAYDPYVPQTTADLFGVQLVDFDTLLAESDFITVHSPATVETNHIFNIDAFRKMKSSAVFINCARGPLVDEAGLQEALQSGEIAAAGIDVTEVEPLDAESPLLKLDNLTISPHVAGASEVSRVEGARRWGENAVNILTGKPLHGLANQEVLKRIAVLRSQGTSRWDGIPDPVTEAWS
ncbi:MAG: C-terminal binding protein [Chloroflexi bacterium]|nr:C-terminal binding protein [Chloroflexota bacterium]MCI0809426.1 C-terminal binding protein [Chloroflexota bacterium]MCI0851835.1 C-terminal binding protein [Chloroflexota bacterium]